MHQGVSDEELLQTLEMLQVESFPLPERLKIDILLRKIGKATREKHYGEAFELLSPWASSQWNYKQPTLAGLTSDPSKRVSLYRKHFLVDVVLKLLLQGKEAADAMVGLSKQALACIEAVDMVTLDASSAIAMDESGCFFKAVMALLTPTLDISLEDRGPCHCV